MQHFKVESTIYWLSNIYRELHMPAEYRFMRNMPKNLRDYSEYCIASKSNIDFDNIFSNEVDFDSEELKSFKISEDQARSSLLAAAIAVRTKESFSNAKDSSEVFAMVIRVLMMAGELLKKSLTESPWNDSASELQNEYPDVASWLIKGQEKWNEMREQAIAGEPLVTY